MAGVASGPADAAWMAAPAFHSAANQAQPKAKIKPAAQGLAPIAEFDPLVPDADFGAPVPVSQTQYIVSGPPGLKPLQVYHDAQNTHIALADQLDRPSVLVPARGGLHPHQAWVRGNQMLVRGVPAEIVLAYPDGRFVSISRLGDPARQARVSASTASLPSASANVAVANSSPAGQNAQQSRQQIEQLQQQQLVQQQQQQTEMLQQELRLAQIRIQELQQQNLEEQTQKIRAQAQAQESSSQKAEALSQLQELQWRLARTENIAASPPTSGPQSGAVGVTPEPSAVAVADASGWILQAGETVASALSRWASASNRRLVWSPKMDVPVRRTKVYHGSLESALQQLTQDLNKALPVLIQIEPQLILVGIAP
jgi:exonuclease VII large subunit